MPSRRPPATQRLQLHIFIADAALRLKTTNDNEFGIDNPYQLTEEQFNAAVDLLTQQSAIVDTGQYWNYATDQIT